MLSAKMQKQLLDQVKYEWESEFYYLAMMAWCYNNDLDGFGGWFLQQANEERGHGMRILKYILDAGGEISIPSVKMSETKFKSLEDICAKQLAHEEKVTGLIHKLMDLAIKESDHATASLLHWFVKEQIEEESTSRNLLGKVRIAGEAPAAVMMLDSQLSSTRPGDLPNWDADDN